MLSKSVSSFDALPEGADLVFEPKWDGFRCIVFRDGDEVELGSRNERPMTRYFPELVDALLQQLPPRIVVDGEIVVPGATGLDFDALQQRIHPAESRVRMLAEKTPASFIAFDLLGIDDEDVTEQSVQRASRRGCARSLGSVSPPIHVTPATSVDRRSPRLVQAIRGRRARRRGCQAGRADLSAGQAGDVQGEAPPHRRLRGRGLPHAQGRQERRLTAARSVRRRRHAAPRRCVRVVHGEVPQGARVDARATAQGRARPIIRGRTGRRCPRSESGRMPGAVSRWNAQKDLSWDPVRIERVIEVEFDQLQSGRFRRVARFIRWRPDRTPESCTYAQLDVAVPRELAEVFAEGR